MTELAQVDPAVLRIAVALSIATALFALRDRRLIIVPLALQYVMTALFGGPVIGLPLVGIRLTLGLAISAMMYITASRMETGFRRGAAGYNQSGHASILPPTMGPLFQLVAMALGVLMAVGFWTRDPLPALQPAMTLTALWLGAVGVMMALIGSDPLRLGIGALVCINAFQEVYLALEPSLLIVALTGVLEILLALAVAYASERWLLVALQEEAPFR